MPICLPIIFFHLFLEEPRNLSDPNFFTVNDIFGGGFKILLNPISALRLAYYSSVTHDVLIRTTKKKLTCKLK